MSFMMFNTEDRYALTPDYCCLLFQWLDDWKDVWPAVRYHFNSC